MKAFRGQPTIFSSPLMEKQEAALQVNGIFLSFGGVMALANVDFSVRTGELISLIGPNGAGKTSMLNCITGYYHPQEGSIVFNGNDLTKQPPHEVTRQGIGRTFQKH